MLGRMSPDKRREQIVRILKSSGSISPGHLGNTLGVSRETVRNDLVALERSGVIERSHGSVRLTESEEAYESLVRSGALSKEERQRAILAAVRENTYVRNAELARTFNVSEATIRADLHQLEQTSHVSRRHGGAVVEGRRELSVLSPSAGPETAAVRQIADRAQSLIERGDLVFLDDSPFCQYLARVMFVDLGAEVVTNSLVVAYSLTSRGYRSEVFMLPGRVIGETASTDFQPREVVSARLHPTRAFLGFCGYTPSRGFFTDTRQQADLADYVLGHSREAYLMVASDGVGRTGNYGVPIGDRSDHLVEILVDEGLDVDRAARIFPRELHVAICGDSYVLKSPFNKQYVIGFATLHMQHEFSRSVRHAIERAAENYPNVELMVADNRMDPETTVANVDAFIKKGVDLVIEYQHDSQLSALIGEKLAHAGIPIIAVDIPVPGAVYFGANNYRAGRIAGSAAAEEVTRRWHGAIDALYVLTDDITGPTPASRITGMLEAFREAVPTDDDRIVRIETENDRLDAAERLRVPLQQLDPDARIVIFGFNDEVTLGALNALQSRVPSENAIVVGHNVTPAIQRELATPGTHLLGAVAFHPDRYGDRIMELAVGILEGGAVNPDNYTEHHWFDAPRLQREPAKAEA